MNLFVRARKYIRYLLRVRVNKNGKIFLDEKLFISIRSRIILLSLKVVSKLAKIHANLYRTLHRCNKYSLRYYVSHLRGC